MRLPLGLRWVGIRQGLLAREYVGAHSLVHGRCTPESLGDASGGYGDGHVDVDLEVLWVNNLMTKLRR